MSSTITHILSKTNYSDHHLVTLPAPDLPPLPPSSLRLRSKILGLTTNNFSYARGGHIMGWWGIYFPPPNTPAPYNNREAYGRIAAWGYAEITESTVPDISPGSTVYGFLPIGTFPETVTVKPTGLKSQFYITDPHRQHVWPIYNRLKLCAPLPELIASQSLDFLGWDALMQGLFATSYNLNRHAFAWDDSLRIHPSGKGKGDWSAADADLDDSTVIVLSASGKTGMSLPYCLRNLRPKEHQPRTIIGVCSATSKPLVESTNFYDTVLLYSDIPAAISLLQTSSTRRVVLLDFGAREGAREAWNTALSNISTPYTFISVGGEVKVQPPDVAAKRLAQFFKTIQVNASELREKGIEVAGDAYFEEFYEAWDGFKRAGAMPGVQLKWGEGMEEWASGWEGLCRDEVGAGTGLVYRV